MTCDIKSFGVFALSWSTLVIFVLLFPGIYVVAPYRVISTWIWTECRVTNVSQAQTDYGVFNNKIRSWFVPCHPLPTRSGKSPKRSKAVDRNNDDIYLSPCFIIQVDYTASDGQELRSGFLYRDVSTVDNVNNRLNPLMTKNMGRKAKSKRLETKNQAKLKKVSKNKRGSLQRWEEERMAAAVAEYFAQKDNPIPTPRKLSIRGLARAYQVPRSTLRDRVCEPGATIKPKIGRKTIFTVETETELVSLLIGLSKQGFGLTPIDVRRLAYQYAKAKDIKGFSEKTELAGYDWMQGFMARNPELSVRKPENLALGRAMNLNETVVKSHFDGLFKVLTDNDLIGHPERIWNTDETGLQDVFESGEVIASTQGRVFNLTGRERGETTTLLSAISADGETAPHLIIFKGKRQRHDLQEQATPGDLIRMSESGWIKDPLITEWGSNFVRYLRRKGALAEKNLLILDGHTTHSLNLDFITTMRENNIILWCIPPHTSHHLQPLDKNVFSSLKKNWNRLGKEKNHAIGGRVLSKDERLALIYETLPFAFTPENIKNGFMRTGIYPFNPTRISSDAFLPSKNSERQMPGVACDPKTVEHNNQHETSDMISDPSCSTDPQDVTFTELPVEPNSQHVTRDTIPAPSCSTDPRTVTSAELPEELEPNNQRETRDVIHTPSCSTDPRAVTFADLPEESNSQHVTRDAISVPSCSTDPQTVTFAEFIKKAENPRKKTVVARKKPKKSPTQNLTSSPHMKFIADKKAPKPKKSPKKSAVKKTVNSKTSKKSKGGRKVKKVLQFGGDEDHCSICHAFYFDQITDEEWICCTTCAYWQHITCANMDGKSLEGYRCPACQ